MQYEDDEWHWCGDVNGDRTLQDSKLSTDERTSYELILSNIQSIESASIEYLREVNLQSEKQEYKYHGKGYIMLLNDLHILEDKREFISYQGTQCGKKNKEDWVCSDTDMGVNKVNQTMFSKKDIFK
jgi:hypothetical protein